MVSIGILHLQGDMRFHEQIMDNLLKKLNIKDGKIIKIKNANDLDEIDGLIIPGGESTVISTLSKRIGLFNILKEKISSGLPILATCAGLILLTKSVYDKNIGKVEQSILEVLDVTSERNSFGNQKKSFETDLSIPILGDEPFKAIFIRAPIIKNVGLEIEVLARFNEEIVAVRQKNIIGMSFHPEMTNDIRMHKLFLDMVYESIIGL